MATRGAVRSEDAAAPTITVFGPFSLVGSDGRAVSLTNRRARALLAMLCVAPGGDLDRDLVSRLLWPGRFPAQARASLRQCLLSLDRALSERGIHVLAATRSTLALKPGEMDSDLSILEDALKAGRTGEACNLLASLGGQPLLEGLDLGAAFDEWLDQTREAVETRLRAAVENALLALKHEEAFASRDLLQHAWTACGRAVARPTEPRRIALVPFEQFDAIGGDLFLAEGVAEELGARLGSIEGLALVGRTSVLSLIHI